MASYTQVTPQQGSDSRNSQGLDHADPSLGELGLQQQMGNAWVQDVLRSQLDQDVLAQTEAGGDLTEDAVMRETSIAGVWLVKDPAAYKTSLIAKLEKGDGIVLLDVGASLPFNKVADPQQKWWRIKVDSGKSQGKVGWVLASTLNSIITVKSAKENVREKVGPGEVSANTDLSFEAGGVKEKDWFSMKYEGKDADQARWLQFIWREVIGVDAKGTASPLVEPIKTSGGSYLLTDGGTLTSDGTPGASNYNTDAKPGTGPFYESGGAADRTADSTTILDQPNDANEKVQRSFANGAKQVVSRAHFHTFLVKQDKVAYQVDTNVEWSFASAKDAPQRKQSQSGKAASCLPNNVATQFHAQHPTYKQIK